MNRVFEITKFKKIHEPAIVCQPVTDDIVTEYQNKLPEEILAFWQENGWCGYADGLLWIVDPADFFGIIPNWLGVGSTALVIARTAFGDMFLWDKDRFHYLDVSFFTKVEMSSNMKIVFDSTFCRDSYLDDILRRPLFKDAMLKLGKLNKDECYAFVPALVAGGSTHIDSIKKVKLLPHLDILSQLHQ